jgi:hypothetical protein
MSSATGVGIAGLAELARRGLERLSQEDPRLYQLLEQ